MYWKYYSEMIKYRLIGALLLVMFLCLFGFFLFSTFLISGDSNAFYTFLNDFFKISGLSVLIAMLIEAIWFKISLSYNNVQNKK